MIDCFKWGDGGRLYVPVCDGCEKELKAAHTREDAVNAIIKAGWTSRRTTVGWSDHCPECERLRKVSK